MKKVLGISIGIIGGADGSTSIYLAGKLNGNAAILLIVAGSVLLAVWGVHFLRKKHK